MSESGPHPNSAIMATPRPYVAVVGTSYRTARIGVREAVAKRLTRLPLQKIHAQGGLLLESATLETCNRIEFYFVTTDPQTAAKSVVMGLSGAEQTAEHFYVKKGIDALRHVFAVASGIDSPVLGEEQILEQVRDAGRTARTSGRAKSILSALFDAAYSSGRRIRETYLVPAANRSVSAFALKNALKELGHKPVNVLLIGSGETAKAAALELADSKVHLLSNRRGVEARFPHAVVIDRGRLRKVAKECDLIIAATRSSGYVLSHHDVSRTQNVVILDLGFPRNVDPSIGSESVRLYDLDAVARWALARRPRVDAGAERMVDEESRRFDAWLLASRLTPTLAAIYRWAERIRDGETQAALRRLPSLSAHDRTVIEALSKRLTGKLLSPHANFVKELGSEGDQSEKLLLLASIFKEGMQ